MDRDLALHRRATCAHPDQPASCPWYKDPLLLVWICLTYIGLDWIHRMYAAFAGSSSGLL